MWLDWAKEVIDTDLAKEVIDTMLEKGIITNQKGVLDGDCGARAQKGNEGNVEEGVQGVL
ncbi:MAG: hypothetical protein Salg2KO_23390 [Salibacteraceae bacterium]